LSAFQAQDTAPELGPVVHFSKRKAQDGRDGSGFGVGRAEDDATHPGLDSRSQAHGTRLQGDNKVTAGQTIIPHPAAGLAKRKDFRMGCGVIFSDKLIAAAADHLPPAGHHGAHRNFAPGLGLVSLLQGQLHELLKFIHSFFPVPCYSNLSYMKHPTPAPFLFHLWYS